jgi:hypothetical protein
MNDIKTIAENLNVVKKSQKIYCLVCGEKQFSIFDKVYCKSFGKCVDCSTPEEVDINSENIFTQM